MKRKKPLPPVRASMCATCPFRPGSEYACLADDLGASALKEGSRICHQTGVNAIGGRTGKPPLLCRGARNLQLIVMCIRGVLDAPTDAAWQNAVERLGL